MKTKVKLLIPMVALTLLAGFSSAPRRAAADCSGDLCGCGVAMQECVAECPAPPDPTHSACVGACRREDVACSIACCS
jgi:hypothetical protein